MKLCGVDQSWSATRQGRWLRWVVSILVVIGGVEASARAPLNESGFAKAGARFVRLLSEGKFAEAAGMFDNVMKSAVTVEGLASSWKVKAEPFGAFVGFGEATVTPYQQYQLVYVPCAWEKGRLRVQVTLDADGRVAGYFFRPALAGPAPVKPAYLVAEAIIERELSVGSKPWILPATLTLPKSGRVRAGIVFVHGSGPNDRDETLYGNKPFRDLAWGLGQKGIATLRYEKRTKAHGAKMVGLDIGVKEEVIDDALAALDVLRKRKELKGAGVYLLGHSLGATLTPEIAEADGKLAGAILLAGVARPFEDVLLDQFTYITSLEPGQASENMLRSIRKKVSALRERKLGEGEQLLGVGAAYWYDLCDRDAEVALNKAASLTCRMLIVQGGRDYQATTKDFELWKSALAGHRAATFEHLDNLNHLFAAGDGKATPIEYTQTKYVDPRVIDLIAAWCTKGE